MMQTERPTFDQALDLLAAEFRVKELPDYVKNEYWEELKQFTGPQFIEITSRLRASFKKRWADDFPLPAQFVEALRLDYQHESKPPPRIEGFVSTTELIPKLLALMPRPGHINTDKEADVMVKKMDEIVDDAFKAITPTPYHCARCEDTGYVWCWFQFRLGLTYHGNEVLYERVPGSPFWVTTVGIYERQDPPMPDMKPPLTPTIARCSCSAGCGRPSSVRAYTSFVEVG